MSVLFLVITLVIYKGEIMSTVNKTTGTATTLPSTPRVKIIGGPNSQQKILSAVNNFVSTDNSKNLTGAESKSPEEQAVFTVEQREYRRSVMESLLKPSAIKPTETQDDFYVRPASLPPPPKKQESLGAAAGKAIGVVTMVGTSSAGLLFTSAPISSTLELTAAAGFGVYFATRGLFKLFIDGKTNSKPKNEAQPATLNNTHTTRQS